MLFTALTPSIDAGEIDLRGLKPRLEHVPPSMQRLRPEIAVADPNAVESHQDRRVQTIAGLGSGVDGIG